MKALLDRPYIMAPAAILILLLCVFWHFPTMGHDYAYFIPMLKDLRIAWHEHGVFNPLFTPSRCLGLPLWANPSAYNLSLVHFLLLIMNELSATVALLIIIGSLSFVGAYLFARKYNVTVRWANYIALAWTLQGAIVVRGLAGHATYTMIGLFPLIFILLDKKKSLLLDLLSALACALILSQYILMSAPYLLVFLFGGALVLLALMKIWRDPNLTALDWRHFITKLSFTSFFFILIVGQRLLAIVDLMKNYGREIPMQEMGLLTTLPYAILSNISFLPHDFLQMMEWNYGNWESVQYAFPALLLLTAVISLRQKNEQAFKSLYFSLILLMAVTLILCSGVLAPLFNLLPILNSMHANPRWNLVTILGILYLAIQSVRLLPLNSHRIFYSLLALAMLVPLLHIDRKNLGMNYAFNTGRDAALNRLVYCYEPIFGYNLEAFPIRGRRINFLQEPLLDPRCYLSSAHCRPGKPLSPPDTEALKAYRLR